MITKQIVFSKPCFAVLVDAVFLSEYFLIGVIYNEKNSYCTNRCEPI